MTDENIENANSDNGENSNTDLEGLEGDALKELVIKEREERVELDGKNRQLFERAKTAEGFEKQEDGSWVKTEKAPETKKTDKESKAKVETKSDKVDYGELAFLSQKGVEHDEDISYIQNIANNTGESLKDVLSKSFVKAELKERAEQRTTADATPKGTKRSASPARSDVDYWVAKGVLPPADQPQLRQDVVNAKLKSEKSASEFTSTPVGNNILIQ